MTKRNLKAYYLSKFDKLFSNLKYRKAILSFNRLLPKTYKEKNEKELFKRLLTYYLEEAELTLSLIEKSLRDKKKILLEVGGGLGFVYGHLKINGYKIHSIEPSESGYFEYYETALEMFRILKIDSSNWYPLSALGVKKINKKFDVIFSNNVLEHVPNLKGVFIELKSRLKPSGIMVHNTVNYLIPYEPHLKILLFPFFPQYTSVFRPGLRSSSLWRGLNFITPRKIKRICNSLDLSLKFHKGVLFDTFKRFDKDPEFAKRQKYFVPLYLLLKYTGLLSLVNLMPLSLTTPIKFTISIKKH